MDAHLRIMSAYQANKANFQEAEAAHNAQIDGHAMEAAESYLFGRDKETKIDRGGLLEMHHISDADFVDKYVPSLTKFVNQCLNLPRVREKAVSAADVGIVFFVDFASVGTLSDKQLRNIVTAYRNMQVLAYDVILLGFYPEKPKGYSQFKKTPAEISAQQEKLAQTQEPETDDDLLVDEDAALPDTGGLSRVKKSTRELRAVMSKDRASIDESLCRGDLDKWYHETVTLPLAQNNATIRDARDGFTLLPVQSDRKDFEEVRTELLFLVLSIG